MFEDAKTTVENMGKVVVNSVSMDLDRFPNLSVSLLNRLTACTSGGFSDTTTQKITEKERKTMGPENKEIKTPADLKAAFPRVGVPVGDIARGLLFLRRDNLCRNVPGRNGIVKLCGVHDLLRAFATSLCLRTHKRPSKTWERLS